MKIDAHQHFWVYNEPEFGWIDDSMKIIQKDFFPVDLKKELIKTGFDGSVAVQARQTLEETRWLLKLTDAHSFIKGVVGWVDLCSSEVGNQLNEFASHSKLVGVRHVIHDELDERFVLREDFQRGIAQLKRYDLTYDILIFPKHLPQTRTFVANFPGQTFILDHLAKPQIKEREIAGWKKDVEALAQLPNVYCKLSGMVTEADRDNWRPEDFRPYLDVVLEAFGTDRLMIGSDWPVCQVAATYSQVVALVENYFASFSAHEQALFFGGNASAFYKLG